MCNYKKILGVSVGVVFMLFASSTAFSCDDAVWTDRAQSWARCQDDCSANGYEACSWNSVTYECACQSS